MESKKINQLATELAPELSDLTIIGDPTTGISKKITLSQMASLFTGTVEEYASLSAFPLVGTADTIYIALDTNILYRWNTGTSAYVELSPNVVSSLVFNDANGFDGTISLVGSVATLTITTALTQGSVPFIGASGALTQDNTNFFWDNSNKRLGINTNTPTGALDVFGSGIIGRLNGTSTNNAFLGFASAGSNKWSIGNVQSDHRFRIYNEAATSELFTVLPTGEIGIGIANPLTKLHIDGGASALIANLDANVSVAKSVSFRSDNSSRFNIEVSGTESGSNAGMDFYLRAYTDAGALLSTPLTITRATGAAAFISTISATGATLTSTQTNLVLNTTTNTSFSKLSFQDNGVEKGTLTYINSAFAATSRRDKLEIANIGGIHFITQNAPLTPDVVIDSSGRLGIGTASPETLLHINRSNSGGEGGYLFLDNSAASTLGNKSGIKFANDTGASFSSYSSSIESINTNASTGAVALTFSTWNGTNRDERLRIVSSGNVGIGTDTPNVSGQGSNVRVLTVKGSGTWGGVEVSNNQNSNDGLLLGFYGFTNSLVTGNSTAGMPAYIGSWLSGTAGSDIGAEIRFFTKANGGTTSQKMVIANTGNVGIGTSSPSTPLYVVGPMKSESGLYFNNTGTNGAYVWQEANTPLRFATNDTERMRITSGGKGLFGTTAASLGASGFGANSFHVQGELVSKGSTAGCFWENRSGGTSDTSNWYGWYTTSGTIYLYNGAANAASINPSTGAYTALNPSDIRIKDNIRNYNKGLTELMKINVKEWEYNGKANTFKGEKAVGFIANEMENAIPEWVGEFETYLDKDDTEKTKLKNININELPYLMLKSIQELKTELEQLKALINK